MLSSHLKPAVTRAITPVSRFALALGLTPNAVSLVGAMGAVASALYFYPRGQLFIGTLVITLFVLSDLFDGTMARLTNAEGTRWGSFVDSTLDRATDAALLVGLALYTVERDKVLTLALLLALITGFLVPYIRAKAESLGIDCEVGVAERTERLIIILVSAGLEGLGVPFIFVISIWILVFLGIVTIIQRTLTVKAAMR